MKTLELKVSLGIGYPQAKHSDIIEISKEDYDECETEEARNELLFDAWSEWAWNYIDCDYNLVKE